MALAVEFLAFLGLFFINPLYALGAVVLAEVAAKLSMVTIVWVGKPAHKGLGAIFLSKAKKNLNAVAYLAAVVIGFVVFWLSGNVFLGLVAVGVMLISVPVAFVMEKVAEGVFGGVSGDMIGATNEVARAVTLIVLAAVLVMLA